MLNARRVNPPLKPTTFFIMPSVVFSFGNTSKEVKLEDIDSVQDVASNMKEVIKEEKDSPHKKNITNG
tara:strand:+ start:363 stop:566 length:204 start_codon:yes stop_codon:yes gene_type:complete